MKHLSFIFLLGLTPLSAQQNGIEQTSELHTVPAGDNFLRWHGHLGRSYFVQVSDTNNPLAKWSWAPIIESGNNEEISYEVDGTATKGFYRLQYTDQTASNLDAADFDGDGLTNLQEITPIYLSGHYIQSNPLNSDSDQDGLPDKWERDNGLDPTDNGSANPDNGPNGDVDHDGFTNLAENAAGTNPQDSSSNPPGTPLPGGAPQLVSEQLHYSRWRYGFNGFQDSSKKYLKSIAHIVTNYLDEADTDADQTVTETTDSKTGNVTYHRVGTPADTAAADYAANDPWIVASDVSRSHSSTQAPTGVSTTVSQTLSDEYTVPAFVSNVENWFPAYLNKFSVADHRVPSHLYIPLFHTHTAFISLIPEPTDPSPAMFYSIAKLRYKWKVNAAPHQIVNWLEVFTPADNSIPIVEKKSWVASPTDTESPVYEIDPTTKNGKKNGAYAVHPVDSVTINTFIPHNNVEDPRPFDGTLFKGDNRNSGTPPRATWDENGSHRTQQKFQVIADQAVDSNGLVDNAYAANADGNGNSDRYVNVGETKSFDPDTSVDASNNITAAALADTVTGVPLMIGKATAPQTEIWLENPHFVATKQFTVKCRCEANNPLVSGSPAISYTINITIDKAAGTYSVEGSHDGFPAYEIYINGKRVYQHDPLATGDGLNSLFPDEEYEINEIAKPLP